MRIGNEVLQIPVGDAIATLDQTNNQWYIAHNVECRDLTQESLCFQVAE